MKSGYDQFFKKVRQQAQPKAKFKLNMTDPNAPKEKMAKPSSSPSAKNARPGSRKLGAKAQRAPVPVPWAFVFVLVVGLGISVWGLLAPKSFEHLTTSIEISAFGSATAADAEKPASDVANKEEKPAETKGAKPEKPPTSKTEWTQEEMSFFSKLNERKKELDLREAELNKLEEELQQQKVVLDKRLKDLEQMRTQIADTLKNQVEVDKDKVDKLVEFYSNMKPQQAAKIMETLNEDLAVETLGRMKKKNAAEIMNLLEPKKAQSISEKFAGYKRK